MPERIIGCPHEEGIGCDGPVYPECPFWRSRRGPPKCFVRKLLTRAWRRSSTRPL